MTQPKQGYIDPESSTIFYKNFQMLCVQHGESMRQVCLKLGISQSTTTRWKHGSSPDTATIAKIANYFNISVGSLIGYKNDGESTILNTEETNLVHAYHKMNQTDKQIVRLLVAKYLYEN